jgi:hypothetical protein
MWFLLFNVGTVLYLIAFGDVSWNLISIVSYSLALLLINILAWISARKFPDWK